MDLRGLMVCLLPGLRGTAQLAEFKTDFSCEEMRPCKKILSLPKHEQIVEVPR